MLFKNDILEGIAAGRVTCAFRRWKRASVSVGTRQRTACGIVEVVGVEMVEPEAIELNDARAAGYASREALLKSLGGDAADPLFRITLRFAGVDPRIGLRGDDDLHSGDIEQLAIRLARLDSVSRHGPWTGIMLALIANRPGTRATDLATELARETLALKRDVRKLKELGLTESLDIGYRLSPRGAAYLERMQESGR